MSARTQDDRSENRYKVGEQECINHTSSPGVADLFDSVVDGNRIITAKPVPEVFLIGAHELEVEPTTYAVHSDAEAILQAATVVFMYAVGIGNTDVPKSADLVIAGLYTFDVGCFFL